MSAQSVVPGQANQSQIQPQVAISRASPINPQVQQVQPGPRPIQPINQQIIQSSTPPIIQLQTQQSHQQQPNQYLASPPQTSQYQPPQQQHQTNPNIVEIKVSADTVKSLNEDIIKTEGEIKDNKKSLRSRLMMAVFFGFCSLAIGIGTNMKYGVGDMSAFESLAGKHGAGGTAENLYNSGSTTDSFRGINFGFAIAGFALPIVGTLLSLIGAFNNFNKIKKGERNNRLRDLAKGGFTLNKTINPELHPNNHQMLQQEISQINPSSEISKSKALALAKAHRKALK
jgi:hypothetical protein